MKDNKEKDDTEHGFRFEVGRNFSIQVNREDIINHVHSEVFQKSMEIFAENERKRKEATNKTRILI